MDRDRVISLVEGEIFRRRAVAEIADKSLAESHLEVARALTEVLNVYRRCGLVDTD